MNRFFTVGLRQGSLGAVLEWLSRGTVRENLSPVAKEMFDPRHFLLMQEENGLTSRIETSREELG